MAKKAATRKKSKKSASPIRSPRKRPDPAPIAAATSGSEVPALPVPVVIAATPAAAATAAQEVALTPPKSTVTNVIDDPSVSLQRFDLLDLQPYTQEKVYSTTASKDFHLFYVGRDNVHDILKHVLSRVSVSLYLNMFGFDDNELNDILMKIALDATITMLVTLDKSQANGPHEKALLDADRQHNLALFNTHFVTKTHVQEFVIGQSATHQISHTKGFVADGRVAGEGSTNWSDSGEGTFILQGSPGGAKYKAQNNTQSIITDPDTVSRFSSELVAEHMVAQKQAAAVGAAANKPLRTKVAKPSSAAKLAAPHPALVRHRAAGATA
jgi:phosphatidylserine/phosphatidylglycerophosphate/cardiolipin synthase-like enzyme